MTACAHSDSSQQTLRHISDDDSDEENDGLQPGVSQNDWQNEERQSQEDSNASDDVNKVLDLLGDGGFPCLQSWGQRGDAAHHGAVTSADHNTTSSA